MAPGQKLGQVLVRLGGWVDRALGRSMEVTLKREKDGEKIEYVLKLTGQTSTDQITHFIDQIKRL